MFLCFALACGSLPAPRHPDGTPVVLPESFGGKWTYAEACDRVAAGRPAFVFVGMKRDREFGEKEVWCEVPAADFPGWERGLYLATREGGQSLMRLVARYEPRVTAAPGATGAALPPPPWAVRPVPPPGCST